jgi:hypothetical protein
MALASVEIGLSFGVRFSDFELPLTIAAVDDPPAHVAKHVGMQPMRCSVGLHLDV